MPPSVHDFDDVQDLPGCVWLYERNAEGSSGRLAWLVFAVFATKAEALRMHEVHGGDGNRYHRIRQTTWANVPTE